MNATTPGTTSSDQADRDPEAEQEVDGDQPPVGERAGDTQERGSGAGWGAGDQHRDRAAVEHLTEEDGDRLRQDGDEDRDRGQVREAAHAVDVDGLVRDGVEQPERDEDDGADQKQRARLAGRTPAESRLGRPWPSE